MTKYVPSMRVSYELGQLGDQDANPDPIEQFRRWFDEACETSVIEANAMVITTVSTDCKPSARTVLMKQFDERGIVYYTNYNSQKGREIAANPNVAALFYWPSVQRQVRLSGVASRLTDEESDAYFQMRPRGSQIGAHASPQSEAVPSQAWLMERFSEVEASFGEDLEIPRPAHWGGIRIVPETIEFWQGRQNRMHDRIRYVRNEGGEWKTERLAP
jgi:pyridoxamine 5'-phosphate oxidase